MFPWGLEQLKKLSRHIQVGLARNEADYEFFPSA